MSRNIYLVGEKYDEEKWQLALPMKENNEWIDPELDTSVNPYWPEYTPHHAKYKPVNEFTMSTTLYERSFCSSPFYVEFNRRGFPGDISVELREYFETYWVQSSFVEEQKNGGWLTYEEQQKYSGYKFHNLQECCPFCQLRLVFWHY